MDWIGRTRAALSQPRLANAGRKTYDVFDFLSKVALVCGILFSIYQFNAYKQDERVRYTFQFIERFDSDRFLTTRTTIEAALRSQEAAIAEINRARVSQDAEVALRRRVALFLINDSNRGQGLVREVELMVDFFDALEICLKERLCDRDTANAFLESHATMLWTNFAPYIEGRRELIPSYGRGLQAFVHEQ